MEFLSEFFKQLEFQRLFEVLFSLIPEIEILLSFWSFFLAEFQKLKFVWDMGKIENFK